jgi:hypothetical protein
MYENLRVITCPHPNPLPKGERIRNRKQILPLKTPIFPALSPLSHRDVCPEGVEGLGVRDGRQFHLRDVLFTPLLPLSEGEGL